MQRRLLPALALLAVAVISCRSEPRSPQAAAVNPVPVVAAERLVIGVASYYSEDIADSLQPLVAYLRRELGIPVELRMAEAYRELSSLLVSGEVDVAQIPPLAYVRLRQRHPDITSLVTPIIGGSPSYLGHVFVQEQAPYDSLRDLEGARIGYVSLDSVSGYLFPRQLVRRLRLDPDAFFSESRFYRSHPEVLRAVLEGEVDAGAAFDLSSDWTAVQERPPGLRVLAKTERIPNDCLVARPGYDPGTLEALTRALLWLRPGRPGAEAVLEPLRVNGWVQSDEERFERIRQVLALEGADEPEEPFELVPRFGRMGK